MTGVTLKIPAVEAAAPFVAAAAAPLVAAAAAPPAAAAAAPLAAAAAAPLVAAAAAPFVAAAAAPLAAAAAAPPVHKPKLQEIRTNTRILCKLDCAHIRICMDSGSPMVF